MKKLLVSVLCASILLTACGVKRDEKQAYIDATIEATCMIFEAENIFDPALEEQAKDIYKKYDFPADDDTAMDAITAKYAEDAEVQAAIAEGIDACSEDFINSLGLEDVETEAVEDETMEEEEGDTTSEEEEGETTELDVTVEAEGEVTVE